MRDYHSGARFGWAGGPGGTLVHLGSLTGPASTLYVTIYPNLSANLYSISSENLLQIPPQYTTPGFPCFQSLLLRIP